MSGKRQGLLSIEVAVATMNERDPLALCERLGLYAGVQAGQVRVLVINQCPDGPLEADVNTGAVRMFSFGERGVSRSRNRALELSEADILLFADDDLRYVEGVAGRVQAAFSHFPRAAIITFPILDRQTGQPKRRFAVRPRRHSRLSITGIGTPEIAVRRSRLDGVRFDEGFGLGTALPQGDEPIFLRDAQRRGLQVCFWPQALCSYEGTSSGGGPWTNALVQTKRAVLQRMYPLGWPAMACAMGVAKYSRHGRDMGLAPWLAAWLGRGAPTSPPRHTGDCAVPAVVPLRACEPAKPGLVSIYIPTRGRAALLPRAIDSALAQTADVEILVVSDGPDDETANLMASRYGQQRRVRYWQLSASCGACGARNHALAHARGQFATGLDDDDHLEPDHVATLLQAYKPELSLVAAAQSIHYPDRQVRYAVDTGIIELQALLHYNKLGNHALTERDRLLAVGGFDEHLPAFQDYDLWVRLVARFGPARKLNVASYHLRVDHGLGRISDHKERKQRALAMFIDKHRPLMSPAHLRSMALLAHKHSGDALPLKKALSLVQRGNEKAVVSLWINTQLPWAQRAYHRLIASQPR